MIVPTYVPSDHRVTVSCEGINFSLKHRDLLEHMAFADRRRILCAGPFFTTKETYHIRLKFDLTLLKAHFRHLTAINHITLLFSQQIFEENSSVSLKMDLNDNGFKIEDNRLHINVFLRFSDCMATMKTMSLVNLAVQIHDITVREIASDIAIFRTPRERDGYCLSKTFDSSNLLFQLSPFWYNQEMRNRLNDQANSQFAFKDKEKKPPKNGKKIRGEMKRETPSASGEIFAAVKKPKSSEANEAMRSVPAQMTYDENDLREEPLMIPPAASLLQAMLCPVPAPQDLGNVCSSDLFLFPELAAFFAEKPALAEDLADQTNFFLEPRLDSDLEDQEDVFVR